MSGERGRVKIWSWVVSILTLGFVPAYTKKTGVSLAPNDGQMAFFGGRPDPVSMALDLSQLDTKSEEHVYMADAFTNLKWWWIWRENLPKVKEHIQRSTSIQELRNINRSQRHRNKVPVYNEILACLTAAALQAIVVSSDDISFRINALLRKLIFKYELGIDLPIIIMGTLCFIDPNTRKIFYHPPQPLPAKEYTVEEQLQDLITVTLEDHDAAHIFNKVAKHYSPDRDDTHKAKESFVRTLTNSHPVNWGTFFKNLEKGGLNKKAYTDYIKRATAIDLDQPVDHKLVSSHFTPSVAY